ncbi:MAG: NAD-binding protein [Hyphomonadaceae bacterium]
MTAPRRFGNWAARLGASFTASASRRTPARRWLILTTLFLVWLAAGIVGWAAEGPAEAAYRTLGALSMQDLYFSLQPGQWVLELARFAGVAIPLVGLLFAFSGALGRSLAQAFNAAASGHVLIVGSGAGALALAQDCVTEGDAVFVIARDLPEETRWLLSSRGAHVTVGDATRFETLRSARADHAAHVIAFEDDETVNLQIEALMRRLVEGKRRNPPIVVHVATHSPGLLQEAREMRSQEQARKEAKAKAEGARAAVLPIDPRPFSLDEIAARGLVQNHAVTILSLAKELKQERPHLVLFGFDDAAEAVAVRAFISLWSAHFAAPRVTVFTADHERAERRFQARYPQAFAHPDLWAADISFQPFDWRERKVDHDLLVSITQLRGPATAIVVSTGLDSDNIVLALALKRACNQELVWQVPIFMKETTQSEFSAQYARGDTTAELDAYLQAFGASELNATRELILHGRLDMGAALAHQHYTQDLSAKGAMSMRDLQAAARGWDEVRETYRDANRASADAAMVKMWDAGWMPAQTERNAETDPTVEAAMMDRMARREHDRWVSERLMNGWRPGPARNNNLRIHPNLTTWEKLTPDEQGRDATQVKAAMQIGRTLNPAGFVKRVD